MKSPLMSADSPFDSIQSETWPGVWPEVGQSRSPPPRSASSSTMSDKFARKMGSNRVLVSAGGPGVSGLLAPLELPRRVEVPGARECRHPGLTVEPGVPPHVIGVKVRVEDRVDVADREARLLKPFHEREGALVPERNEAFLSVAPAGVHEEAPPLPFDDERLDAHDDAPALVPRSPAPANRGGRLASLVASGKKYSAGSSRPRSSMTLVIV